MIKDGKILIVDDDQNHLSLVERYVSTFGLPYTSANSATIATELLKTENISIVVTDMVMPIMDGMELLKHTKQYYKDVDVIIMTGYSKEYSYIDVIQAGATDFIEKPFRKDELAAKIDRVFRERLLLNALRESKEKAESGSKAKTAFLCTISHELRTPMNGILGFTELLGKANLPPEEMEYVKLIGLSTNRLGTLINQILDFSKIEAGKNDLSPSHFQLNSVFESLFVSSQPKATQKGLTLDLQAEESQKETVLFGDMMALGQILNNLVDNAIKCTDSGSIEIQVKQLDKPSKDTIELQFSVKDSGCGIDPEKQSVIFEPFTQADEYMTRRHEGSGLGLAICAKLVSMMNGKIWLDSQVNKGSAFYFTAQMKVA